ncbi:MAG: hypothetical protein HY096_09625 [Nitrospinae bacterium]|nr:hypothetical protein [Nitrospinota bacterium]
MPWQSLTLDSIFGGLKLSLDAQKTEVNKLLKKGNLVLGNLQGRLDAMNSLMSNNTSLADKLSASGIYVLYLQPGQGGWASRAQSESGAPPNDGYSAGVLMVVTGPDAMSIADKYQKIYDTLTTPIL